MGRELTNESVEARNNADSASFAAGLSADMWSPDAQVSAKAAAPRDANKQQDLPAQLTIVALADSSKSESSKQETNNPESSASDAKADGKKESATEKAGLTEANSFLYKAALATENQSIFKLPRWASGLPKPSPDLGCVSSFTNRYREALRLSGLISSTDDSSFRNLTQVNMDELNKVMGVDKSNPDEQLMRKIDPGEAKEGDILEARNPGTSSRHMGILGGIENGKRVVYNNYGGIWRKDAIDDRFGRYKEWTFYRAYLPPKK